MTRKWQSLGFRKLHHSYDDEAMGVFEKRGITDRCSLCDGDLEPGHKIETRQTGLGGADLDYAYCSKCWEWEEAQPDFDPYALAAFFRATWRVNARVCKGVTVPVIRIG